MDNDATVNTPLHNAQYNGLMATTASGQNKDTSLCEHY
jgi:hypothetical protein